MTDSNYENIGEIRKFDADDYPAMVSELTVMLDDMHHVPVPYKRDIIISYLKDRAIRQEWTEANPDMVALMVSGSRPTWHLETLFGACKWNKPFRTAFERYIRDRVN